MLSSLLKKPHPLRCSLAPFKRRPSGTPPRLLGRALRIRLFQQTASVFFVFVMGSLLVSNFSEAVTEEQKILTEEQNKQLLEETKDYKFKTVTTEEGLHFNIPEDMPIERRAGVVAPMPFDEYMYFKFKKLEERLVVIEKKIDDLQQMLISSKKPVPQPSVSPAEKASA